MEYIPAPQSASDEASQALEEVANIVKPDTILGWNRKRVAQKFDGFTQRKFRGRFRVDKDLEDFVIQMAKENRSWGYDRIASALAHLGYGISDQIVGNILKCRGLPPAPEREKTTTWKACIRAHSVRRASRRSTTQGSSACHCRSGHLGCMPVRSAGFSR